MLEELRGIRVIASQIAELQRAILVALATPPLPSVLHEAGAALEHAVEEVKHEIEG